MKTVPLRLTLWQPLHMSLTLLLTLKPRAASTDALEAGPGRAGMPTRPGAAGAERGAQRAQPHKRGCEGARRDAARVDTGVEVDGWEGVPTMVDTGDEREAQRAQLQRGGWEAGETRDEMERVAVVRVTGAHSAPRRVRAVESMMGGILSRRRRRSLLGSHAVDRRAEWPG